MWVPSHPLPLTVPPLGQDSLFAWLAPTRLSRPNTCVTSSKKPPLTALGSQLGCLSSACPAHSTRSRKGPVGHLPPSLGWEQPECAGCVPLNHSASWSHAGATGCLRLFLGLQGRLGDGATVLARPPGIHSQREAGGRQRESWCACAVTGEKSPVCIWHPWWQVAGAIKSVTSFQTPELSEGAVESGCPEPTLKAGS